MNNFPCPLSRAILVACISSVSLAQAAESTLCTANEIPIFSCKLKNMKTVSICAYPHAVRGHVDYRFGTKSKVELTYSANANFPGQKFHRGEVTYANNSDEMIWFTNGKYRYSVYSPIRGGPGLTVSLHGEFISRLECDDSGRGATEALSTASPFIVEHGTGDLTTFEKLWGDQ